MTDKDNTKEELILKLQKLQQENDSLKVKYDNFICKQSLAEKALQESEENYRNLLDLAPDAFFQGDEKGNIIMANKKATQLTGFTKDELLTMNMRDFFLPSILNQKPLRYDLLDRGETISIEREITRKDSSTVIVEMSSRKMPNNTYQSFMRNITERKQAEEALRESEEKFRTIFNESPIGVELYNANGMQIDANAASLNMFGISNVSEIQNFNIYDGTSLDDEKKEKLRRGEPITYQAVFDFDKVVEYQQYRTNKSGKSYFDYIITPLLNGEQKDTSGYLLQVQDITERKLGEIDLLKAKDAIQEREERFRLMIKNSNDAFVLINENGEQVYISDASTRDTGYTIDELKGPIQNVIYPEDLDVVLKAWNEVLAKKDEVVRVQYRHKHKYKEYIWYEAVAQNFLDNPLIKAVVVNVRDITLIKETEIELRKAKEEAEESEKKYRLVFDNAPLGIIHYNNIGEIISCNEKFVEIIGSSKNALVGLSMMKLPDNEIVVAVKKSLSGVLGYYDNEYHSVTANKITPVQIIFAPIFSRKNEIIGGVGIIEDVTERKKNEAKLKKQNEEYLVLNEELQQANENLYNAKIKVEESEAFLLSIFENIPNMIFIKNADDLSFFKLNKAGEQLLGFNRDELIGKNDYDFFSKEQADFLTSKDREVFNSEEHIIILEEKVNTKFGEIILYTKKIAIKDNEGNNKYLLGISEDITEKKEVEYELNKAKQKAEENEARYSSIVKILPDGVIIHSNGIIVYANESAVKILKGKCQDDYYGKPAISFVHPDYRELAIQRIKKSIVEKTNAELVDEVFIDSDGNPVNVLVAGIPFRYQGQPSMLTVFTDITRIKSTEQELITAKEKAEENEKKFRILVETSPDGIVLTDLDGNYLFRNAAYSENLGYSATDELSNC